MSSGFGKAAGTSKASEGKAKASGGKAKASASGSSSSVAKVSGSKSAAGGGIKAAKALSPGKNKDKAAAAAASTAGAASGSSDDKTKDPASPAGSGAKAVLALKEKTKEAPASAPAPAPAPEPVVGKVKVRYNHYNEEFTVTNGTLEFEPIDKQYSISFVFKGEWSCYLTCTDEMNAKIFPDGGSLSREMRPDPDGFNSDDEEEVFFGTFSGIQLFGADGSGKPKQYVLNVDEDPADANKPKTVYKAASSTKGRVLGGDDEDAAMGLDKASCSCLFGNPCAVAENCKDWRNRFEVAKKNGWKGFS